MIEVIIIGQNEGKFVNALIASLPTDWKIHYVADRCIDNTLQELSKFSNVNIIDTTDMQLEGRQTSFCRNFGLSLTDSKSDILFLDGDRYITEGDIVKAYDSMKTDVMCLPLENDFRSPSDFAANYGRVMSGFFSCGIFFRRNAIDKILEFRGELFPVCLQDVWGIEDTSLGDVCYHLGLTASLSENVRLRGEFDKIFVDSIDVIERRLKFRDRLNVRWD